MALPKRAFVITAVSFLFIGVVLLLNSFQGSTGYAILEGTDYVKGFYVALWFLVSGGVVFAIAKDKK